MPVSRVDNYFDAYRLRAQAEDIHELAARPNKKALTEFVSQAILDRINVQPGDVLVDIGCGDASLLRAVAGMTTNRIGVVATAEEKQRLEPMFPGIRFIAARAQCLPIDSNSATKIVCNTTLMYLVNTQDVVSALSEMVRIARPGATIYIGEIPEVDEYAYYQMYRGTSIVRCIWHLRRYHGLRSALGMVRRWLRAAVGLETIVLNSAGLFYATANDFLALSERSGLILKEYFRHRERANEGITESEVRYDYVFTV